MLYTADEDNEVKAFNLLNVSDIFGTEREEDSSGEYYFYLNDARGSKTNLIDDTAAQVVSYWYNDFGEVSEERSEDYEEFVNEVQYTGAIYDSSTGLLYLNARFYDPSTGRFISQDSYRGENDDSGTWNLYVYCANDPINYLDSSGHSFYSLIWSVVSIGVAYACIISPSSKIVAAISTIVGAVQIYYLTRDYKKANNQAKRNYSQRKMSYSQYCADLKFNSFMYRMAVVSTGVSVFLTALGLGSSYLRRKACYKFANILINFGVVRSLTIFGACYDAADLICNPWKLRFRYW